MLAEEILSEIRKAIAAERQGQWDIALAQARNERLDPERSSPSPDHALWQNLLSQTEKACPPVGKKMQPYLERNELGDAELFQFMHGNDFVFNHNISKWLNFDGVVWQEDILRCSVREVMNMAALYEDAGKSAYAYFAELRADVEVDRTELNTRMTALETSDDDNKEEKKRLKKQISDVESESDRLLSKARSIKKSYEERARALRAIKRTEQVLKASASGNDSMGRTANNFDQHPTLLAFSNGIVDLETGKMVRPSPHLYITKTSKYPYTGLHIHSAWWEDHLHKIFCGNEELINYFEYCIGYSATGLQVNKHLYCAIGPHADNGKSVTFNTIKKVLGDVATTIKVDVLLEEKYRNRGPDPDLMVLDGIRLGIASEAPSNCSFSMDRIKSITGGDDIRARGMYADSKIIDSKVKLFLHTNDVPNIVGYDPGFMLRLRLIPFDAQFVAPEQVNPRTHKYPALGKQQLERQLDGAYPAIVSWIIRCARKFLHNTNYATPEIVLQNTKNYFETQDIIGNFIETCCETGHQHIATTKTLWKVFEYWSVKENAVSQKSVLSMIKFSRELKKRSGIEQIQNRPTTKWSGLTINASYIGKELD